MTRAELKKILAAHKKWLNDEPGGKRADLSGSNLSGSNLSGSDLRDSNLSGSDLRDSNLSGSNLSGSNLSGSNLRGSDLSGAVGLVSQIDYMRDTFERTDNGYIAYKTFGQQFKAPESWKIEPGSVISENVNFDRCNGCACGINAATLDWVRREMISGDIWKVLIRWEWLAGVCVPYNTDGKIRCERVELVEIVER